MRYGPYGEVYTTSDELCELLYKNPELNIFNFEVDDPSQFNQAVTELHAELAMLQGYKLVAESVEAFDQNNQSTWFMPLEYRDLDIAKWILEQCKTEAELQRVGEELLMFQEREAFDLLRYLKYFVDTLRANNIVWGVGRGSSVASYVLYLIGVHKINSLYYQLPIEEFLK